MGDARPVHIGTFDQQASTALVDVVCCRCDAVLFGAVPSLRYDLRAPGAGHRSDNNVVQFHTDQSPVFGAVVASGTPVASIDRFATTGKLDCAACRKPADMADQWVIDNGSGLLDLCGRQHVVKIGIQSARLVGGPFGARAPQQQVAVPDSSVGFGWSPVMGRPAPRGGAAPRAALGGGFGQGISISNSKSRKAGAAPSCADVSFEFTCGKQLADLEDLGDGLMHCESCNETVHDCGADVDKANKLGSQGKCVSIWLADPANIDSIRVKERGLVRPTVR